MKLTKAQIEAMLELGGSAEGHGFLPQRVLDELLSCELIYWRKPDEIDFTSSGKEVYDELVSTVRMATGEGKGLPHNAGFRTARLVANQPRV